ncbi:hypothetical protein [Nitrospirillum sp. BR 11828]|uniref:hypothetical protein n=1 Tax=Nitrospirillum sp. BR 11828 TaxID=3104325 RepID=UPI002ACA66CD|nr:hypothetical protein [Nitrospirillum sp. BR 11828]MDZ5648223.1 hypothetical protein [Nitrospirillum sp. BR 11828]
MKMTNALCFHAVSLIAVAMAASVPATAKTATAAEIKLATAKEGLAICRANKMGNWDLAYIAGKDGLVQWGPGYDCKQSRVPGEFSTITSAMQADGTLLPLATLEEGLLACRASRMGQWDLAYILGKNGLVQWGPGYACKQSAVPGDFSDVDNALVK